MANLLSSLMSSANALSVFERALLVSQNNVANASTPGYAAQRVLLEALDFNPDLGLTGGVRVGEIQNARSQYAEQSVRRQLQSLGFFEQAATNLATIEAVFTISGESAIPAALNRLFQSFSAWSLTPNSTAARQTVIDSARQLAAAFQQAAAGLAKASTDADRQIQQTVWQINQLGAKLLDYNLQRRRGAVDDAGLDAKIHASLEELSQFVDFTAMFQPDGSVSVLLGGQTPLVIGDHHFDITVSSYYPTNPPPVYPAAAPTMHILGAEGRDITRQITEGRLGALLSIRNSVLPSLRGDAYPSGDLNLLAKTIADRVNQILTSGWVSDGPPPETGVALFTYDATNDTAVAQSLTLNSSITPALLAAIDPGPPYVSNGTALHLARLANPQDAADRINGFSFTEFYGNLAARVGRELTDMRDNETLKAQMAAQARNLRSEISGVSLDEEAILMVEFQRAYQANARMVSVLTDLTEVALNFVR